MQIRNACAPKDLDHEVESDDLSDVFKWFVHSKHRLRRARLKRNVDLREIEWLATGILKAI